MNQESSVTHHVQEYLKHFAAFLAHVSEGHPEAANAAIESMNKTECEAQLKLSSADVKTYRMRRAKLSRLFRQRLFKHLEDQIEKSVIEETQELIKKYEGNWQ